MITFCIPLLSRRVASDWQMVTTLFNRTLWSCYNQTCPEFRIIVACHEIPKLDKRYDDRVEFIQVDAPIPRTQHEKMIDKGYKTHTCAMRLRELGGGYGMLVDADDLVSNRLAQYVHDMPDENGFYIKSGYVYFVGDSYMKKLDKFSSGTAFIVNYAVEDLPDAYPEVMTDNNNENECLMRKKHGSVAEECAKAGRPLRPLPFRAAVYVLGSGENHSLYGKTTKYQTLLRSFVQLFVPRCRFSEKLKAEFSIDWL